MLAFLSLKLYLFIIMLGYESYYLRSITSLLFTILFTITFIYGVLCAWVKVAHYIMIHFENKTLKIILGFLYKPIERK